MARNGNNPGVEDFINPNGRNLPVALVFDDRDRPIQEHVVSILDDPSPGIVRPQIQAPYFNLKLVMFQMLQTIRQFSGLPIEDPRLQFAFVLGIL